MIIDYNICLNIDIDSNAVIVNSKIKFNQEIFDLRININKGLLIDNVIDSNGNKINFSETLDGKVMFVKDAKTISLDIPIGTKEITLNYKGSVSGWHNKISNNYVALNYYSAWYPIIDGYDMNCNKTVHIKNLRDFTIINSKFINDEWVYTSRDFDCNIIALKGWSKIREEIDRVNLNIYFEGNKNNEINHLQYAFIKIINYYSSLLGSVFNKEETYNIVISKVDMGGYCRKGLIVLSELPDDMIEVDAFLAHECGHIWSVGADTTTWEDWLNETFAEILSLYYIKEEYGQDVYDRKMYKIREIARNLPPIYSESLVRPDGVHFKGTYLMHKLSKKFSEETVIKIARIFVSMEEKTTKNLILEVENKISEEVSRYIEDNLT